LHRLTTENWMSGSTVVNTIATAYNVDGEVTSTGDNYSNYAFAYSGQLENGSNWKTGQNYLLTSSGPAF
jgi:hypothetical protein